MAGLSRDAPTSTLLGLPRELRDQILTFALLDVDVYITTWACHCSILDDDYGSRLRLSADFSGTADEPVGSRRLDSLDMYVNSSIFRVCKQINSESIGILRRFSRYILLITELQRYPLFVDSCPSSVAEKITALCFADVCAPEHESNSMPVDVLGYFPPEFPLTNHFPNLSSLLLVIRVSISMANTQFLEVYRTGYLTLLRNGRISQVQIIIGHQTRGRPVCSPDADFEESCLYRQSPTASISHQPLQGHRTRSQRFDSGLLVQRSLHSGLDHCTWGDPEFRVAFQLRKRPDAD